MALTCGGCYHYRSGGRCRNKGAATYNAYYDSDSQGCQLHITKFLLPFGLGINIILAIIYIPLQILTVLSGGDSNS